MTRANRLLELQAIDLKLDELRARRARVGLALKADRAVAAARDAVARTAAELDAVEHRLRQADQTRSSAESHLGREEGQLYGGKVKAGKELQGLQREVEALRRQMSQLDDAMLEAMIERDEAKARAQDAADALASAEAATAGQRTALLQRERDLADRAARLEHERAGVVATIATADLAVYDRLRLAKGGRAVTELGDGSCQACGMMLPMLDIDHIRSGHDHVLCPSCGRIVLG